MTNHQPAGFAGHPPWRRRGFVVAAAFVAAVVVAGVVTVILTLTSHGGRPTTASPGRSDGAPAATRRALPGSAPTAVPTTAPAGVRWRLLGSFALPYSASAGPVQVSDTASGYARTPVGALIASAQLLGRGTGPDPSEAAVERTITQQFVAGPDRDRLLAHFKADPGTDTEAAATNQIGAFQVGAYSPDSATVSIAVRLPSSTTAQSYRVATVVVRWVDGDWRMVPPAGGDWQSVIRPAPNLIGFVAWGSS